MIDEVVRAGEGRVAEVLTPAGQVAELRRRTGLLREHAEAELPIVSHRPLATRAAEAERVAGGLVELVDLRPLHVLDLLDHQLRDPVAALDVVVGSLGRC